MTSSKVIKNISPDSKKHCITIAEYYENKNVFITGGNGFLGKVLIEKLLRCCPKIGKIYILLRLKHGRTLQQKLNDMLEDQLFNTLKQKDPKLLQKIIPLVGDCSKLKIGLSETDYQLITSSVSVIYNIAASVRFDNNLNDAILLNTRGTQEISQLALQTQQLSVFVHVSTTYCNNIVGKEVKEVLYPPPSDWRKAISIVENFDKEQINILSHLYLGDYPNTYTYTKSLAEHVVQDLCGGKIPCVICRPSIVINAVNDPLEGWFDNLNGPMGILVACGKGLVRVSYQKENHHPDYIPVDIVIKGIIATSWDLGMRQQKTNVEVVQCCAGYNKWVSMGDMVKITKDYSSELPFDTLLWVPKGYVSESKIYTYISIMLFHLLPALFFDGLLMISGYKPKITRLQKKIFIASLQLRYFTWNEWNFSNKNFLGINDKILEVDKLEWDFTFQMDEKNIKKFWKNAILGARRYIFKENDENLPRARKNYFRMYLLDKAMMSILYATVIWTTIYLFNYYF